MKKGVGMLLTGAVVLLLVGIGFALRQRDVDFALEREPQISVYDNKTGAIFHLPMEEYIAGVVAGEMYPNWPREAYAAQVIFARSFTFAHMEEGGMKERYGTDVSTDITETQSYNEDAITKELRAAVESTRGMVMVYDNDYVKAWFHAYSGGVTASAKEGLDYQGDEPPYIRVVRLPENEYAPLDVTDWQASYSEADLRARLAMSGVDVGKIQDIQITERGETERITRLEIRGEKKTKEITGPAFRLAVDSTIMRSTLVSEFLFDGESLVIRGKGYGHGVGLSQWDAYKLAREGKDAKSIVLTFFPLVRLTKLYP